MGSRGRCLWRLLPVRNGVEIETVPLKLEIQEGWLYEIPDSEGIPTRLVTKIDGNAFNEFWCYILCR